MVGVLLLLAVCVACPVTAYLGVFPPAEGRRTVAETARVVVRLTASPAGVAVACGLFCGATLSVYHRPVPPGASWILAGAPLVAGLASREPGARARRLAWALGIALAAVASWLP